MFHTAELFLLLFLLHTYFYANLQRPRPYVSSFSFFHLFLLRTEIYVSKLKFLYRSSLSFLTTSCDHMGLAMKAKCDMTLLTYAGCLM